MSLMCNPLSCGTVLCCRISMASRTCLVCQCGMDVMRLLSSQLILCCCCACFTMADLFPRPLVVGVVSGVADAFLGECNAGLFYDEIGPYC